MLVGLPLLICTWMLAWGGMKLSLPALPELEHVFNVPGHDLRVTVTIFFVCFALGQLAWGIISDHFGRRWPLIIGLMIGAIGSTVVLFSGDVIFFGIGRCLEGLGLSAVSPIGRAIVFQTRGATEGSHALARVGSCTALVPLLGQVLGGYIVAYASWRWIFGGFLIANVLVIVAIWWRLAEPPPLQSTEPEIGLGRRLIRILRHPAFWSNTIMYMTCSGTLLGYYAAMPFWYADHLDVPIQMYPWLAAFTVGTYMLGLLCSRFLAKRMNAQRLMWIGMLLAMIPGILFLTMTWKLSSNTENITLLVGASMILAAGASLVFPGANAGAIKSFPQWSGLVSAAILTCVFVAAGVTAYTLGSANPTNLHEVGWNLLAPPAIGLVAGSLFHMMAKRSMAHPNDPVPPHQTSHQTM